MQFKLTHYRQTSQITAQQSNRANEGLKHASSQGGMQVRGYG